MKPGFKNALIGLLTLGFSAGVCLVLTEILFRTVLSENNLRPKEWSDRPPFYYVPEGAPTLQDKPHLAQKPANTFRIAIVGDSFTFGPYMQFDDTFSKRLERMLNLNDAQTKVEVINYGVPRYSTNHEIAMVERALREQADLVVLQITLNDPEIQPFRPSGLVGGAVDRFGGLQFTSGILLHWKTGAFIAKRIYNSKSKQKYIQYFYDLWEQPKTKANFVNSFHKIVDITAKAHTPFVAMVFPLIGLPTDASYPFGKIHEYVKGYCDQSHVASLDLFDSFKGIPIDRLQTIVGKDFHPNEIGHRIAAEQLYQFLVSQNVLPKEVVIKTQVPERIGIQLPETH